ncbi:MAG TPA: hypothetical protein VIO94_15405 [Phenylobacterium sp.]
MLVTPGRGAVVIKRIIAWIDRDVARWNGNPLATMLLGCVPTIAWLSITRREFTDAPALVQALLVAPMVLFGGVGIWRGWLFIWSEHRRIQALGEAEDAERRRKD